MAVTLSPEDVLNKMTTTDQEKRVIRKMIKTLKAAISLEEKISRSSEILTQLEKSPTFQESKTVMMYWSMDDEVYTHDFIKKWANRKRIILPSVQGDQLILKEFTNIEGLTPGEKYGISEPDGPELSHPEQIDLIIVPGVAFDIKNNRMGRGKAYYDKTLSTLKAIKIGICFNFQLLEQVPTDPHDIKMDLIISE